MLATMERVNILQTADSLAEMVLQSEAGENYQLALYKMRNDGEAQQKIRKFASLKDLYEETQRFGKYHPDYKRVNLEIREAKREMDLHPSIAEFKRAETELQGILDEISMKVGHAVSPHIKVPTGNPFFESLSSCSGGCGSGGSCGCSA
ncbi:YlbF family regulator [Bacillus sp. V5-8f]|uniref:YlbF family regulator n=1 Tax=Bacillus sp. V5-8f TaxID=2053044 RepID=UPI000C759A52|nr:YlbF family regulator [Bacillus sp. V5-8f]PLT34322.1 regulator [Bacillus sp. V5-8f]